jgi:L-fuconolactonase
MTASSRTLPMGVTVPPADDWLAGQAPEDILDPELPIVDPHHHLWDRPQHRYLLDELLADTGSGHRVQATVFVDCMAFYRQGGPVELRPLGETEFANGVAAMAASGVYGSTQACAGIVSFADLSRGAAAGDVLQAQIAAGNGRFRGIRHAGGWDASDEVRNSHTNPPQGLYGMPAFREGFAQLAPLGLSFEAWQYHPQLPEVIALARAFPQTSIILNHCGGPLGIGPYAGKSDQTHAVWLKHMRELASCPNVTVKLGGLGMRVGVFDFHLREHTAHVASRLLRRGPPGSSPASRPSVLSAACSRATSRSTRSRPAMQSSGMPSSAWHKAPRQTSALHCLAVLRSASTGSLAFEPLYKHTPTHTPTRPPSHFQHTHPQPLRGHGAIDSIPTHV